MKKVVLFLFLAVCVGSCGKKEESYSKSSITAEQQKTLMDEVQNYDGPLHIAVSQVNEEKPTVVGEPIPLRVTFDGIEKAKVKWSIVLQPGTKATIVNSNTLTPSLIADQPGIYVLRVNVTTDTGNVSSLGFPISSAYAAGGQDSRLTAIVVTDMDVTPPFIKPAQSVIFAIKGFEDYAIFDAEKYKSLSLWPYDYFYVVQSPISGKVWNVQDYTSVYLWQSTGDVGTYHVTPKVRNRQTLEVFVGPTKDFRVSAMERKNFLIGTDSFLPPYLKGYIGCIHPALYQDDWGCGSNNQQCIFNHMKEKRQQIGFFNLSEQLNYDEFENGFESGKIHSDDTWIYVADKYNHRVQIFDQNECVQYADRPRYIRNKEAACFCMPKVVLGKIDPSDAQKHVEGAGNGEFTYPMDVATDERGMVYVLDTKEAGYKRVQVFDRNQGFKFIRNLDFSFWLINPTSIAYRGGKLFIADKNGILFYDLASGYQRVFGNSLRKGSVEVDSTGKVWVLTNTGTKKYVWNPDGESKVESYIAQGSSYLLKDVFSYNNSKEGTKDIGRSQDMTLDESGHIYLANQGLPVFDRLNQYRDFYSSQYYPYDPFSYPYFLFKHLTYQDVPGMGAKGAKNWTYTHNVNLGAISVTSDYLYVHNLNSHTISIFNRNNWIDVMPEYFSKNPEAPSFTFSGESKNVYGDGKALTETGTQVIDGVGSTLTLHASVSNAPNPGVTWNIARQAVSNQLELSSLDGLNIIGKVNATGNPLTLQVTAQAGQYFKSAVSSKNIEFDVQSAKPKGDFTIMTAAPYFVGKPIHVQANFTNPETVERLFYMWEWHENNQFNYSSTLNEYQNDIYPDHKGSMKISLYVEDIVGSNVLNRVGPFEKTVTVLNSPPIVSLSTSADVTELKVGGKTTVTAQASDADKDAMMYSWRLLSQPQGSILNVSQNTGLEFAFQPDRKGRYEIEFQASDGEGTSKKTVVVDVKNTVPAVQVTGPTRVKRGEKIELAAIVTDPDVEDPRIYTWMLRKPHEDYIKISQDANVTYIPDRKGSYEFVPQVSDGTDQNMAVAYIVEVTVDPPDAKISLSPEKLFVQESASLNAESSTISKFLTYQWKLIQKPELAVRSLASVDQKELTFSPDHTGNYELELTIFDEGVPSLVQKATLTVPSESPSGTIDFVSSAPYFTDVSLDLKANILNRESSEEILSYTWSAVGGNLVVDPKDRSLIHLTPTRKNDVKVTLYVSDGVNTVGPIEKTVNVLNSPPDVVMPVAPSNLRVGISAQITAQATDKDKDAMTYSWQILKKPQNSSMDVSSNKDLSLLFKPDRKGLYEVEFQASDGEAVSKKTISIDVKNTAPTVQVVGPTRVKRGEKIELSGIVTDPDVEDSKTYTWMLKKPNENSIKISQAANVAYIPDRKGSYEFSLQVSDGTDSNIPTAYMVEVYVDPPTAAIQLSPENIFINDRTTVSVINGTVSSYLTYSWTLQKPTQSSVTLSSTTAPSFDFIPDWTGDYLFELKVADEGVESGYFRKVLTVLSEPPQGSFAVQSAPNYFQESPIALVSTLVNRESWEQKSYFWRVLEGDQMLFETAWQADLNSEISFPKKGIFRLQLFATDNIDRELGKINGLFKSMEGPLSEQTIEIENSLPIASILISPEDRNVKVFQPISIRAQASDRDDEDTLSYAWRFKTKPAGSLADLSLEKRGEFSLNPDRKGNYEIELTATDSDGGVAKASRSFTVDNSPPVAVITGVISPMKRGQTLPFRADVVDPDPDDQNKIQYVWELIKPDVSMASLASLSLKDNSFTPDRKGNYVIILHASDGKEDSQTVEQQLTVDVNPPTANIQFNPAQVFINQDLMISAINTPSSNFLTYIWKLISKPQSSERAPSSAEGSSISYRADRTGTYEVELIVSDEGVASQPIRSKITIPSEVPTGVIEVITSEPYYKDTVIDLKANFSNRESFESLTYDWSAAVGTLVKDQNDSSKASFIPNQKGDFKVAVMVSDGINRVGPIEKTIHITNRAPQIQSVQLSEGPYYRDKEILVKVFAVDPDQDVLTVNWQWEGAIPGGLSSVSSTSRGMEFSFIPQNLGNYPLRVEVSDAEEKDEEIISQIMVENQNPSAALQVKSNALGFSFVTAYHDVLTDRESYRAKRRLFYRASMTDPDQVDRDSLTYTWTLSRKPPGSSATLETYSDPLEVSFILDLKGEYQLDFQVRDANGGSFTKSAIVNIENSPPFPNIVGTFPANRGELLTYRAYVKDDNIDDIHTYSWILEKPKESLAILSSVTENLISFQADRKGTYKVSVTVSDGTISRSASRNITVEVAPPVVTVEENAASRAYLSKVFIGDGATPVIYTGFTDRLSNFLEWQWKVENAPDGAAPRINYIKDNQIEVWPDKTGDYTVELVLIDEGVASLPVTKTFSVPNRPPTVTVERGKTKDGKVMWSALGGGLYTYYFEAKAHDPDGDLLQYNNWKVNTTNGSTPGLERNSLTPHILGVTPGPRGEYTAILDVSDGKTSVSAQSLGTIWDAPAKIDARIQGQSPNFKFIERKFENGYEKYFVQSGIGDHITVDLSISDMDQDPHTIKWYFNCTDNLGRACYPGTTFENYLQPGGGALVQSFTLDHLGKYDLKYVATPPQGYGQVGIIYVETVGENQMPSVLVQANGLDISGRIAASQANFEYRKFDVDAKLNQEVVLKIDHKDPEGLPTNLKWQFVSDEGVYDVEAAKNHPLGLFPKISKATVQVSGNELRFTPDVHGWGLDNTWTTIIPAFTFQFTLLDGQNTIAGSIDVRVKENHLPKLKLVGLDATLGEIDRTFDNSDHVGERISYDVSYPGTYYVDDIIDMIFEVGDQEQDQVDVQFNRWLSTESPPEVQKIDNTHYRVRHKLIPMGSNALGYVIKENYSPYMNFERIEGRIIFTPVDRPAEADIKVSRIPNSTGYRFEALYVDPDHIPAGRHFWYIVYPDGVTDRILEWKINQGNITREMASGPIVEVDNLRQDDEYKVRVEIEDVNYSGGAIAEKSFRVTPIVTLENVDPVGPKFNGNQAVRVRAHAHSARGIETILRLDANGNQYLDKIATESPAYPVTLQWMFNKIPTGNPDGITAGTMSAYDQLAVATQETTYMSEKKGTYEICAVPSSQYSRGTIKTIEGPKACTQISRENTVPIATIEGPSTVKRGDKIILKALVTDPDQEDAHTVQWAIRKPDVSLNNLSSLTAEQTELIADRRGEYEFKLIAKDLYSSSPQVSHRVQVEVDSPQAAIEFLPASLFVRDSLVLNAIPSTFADFIKYNWQLKSKPTTSQAGLTIAQGRNISFVPDKTGTYGFELTLDDEGVASAPITATYVVPSEPPKGTVVALSTAPFLNRKPLILQAAVTNREAEESLNFLWSSLDGLIVSDAQDQSKIKFTPNKKGLVHVNVMVSDGANQVPMQGDVNIANTSPEISSINFSGETYRGETISLNYAASDLDGDQISPNWTLLSKPDGSNASLSESTSQTPSFVPDKLGDYRLGLIVSDNEGKQSKQIEKVLSIYNRKPVITIKDISTTTVKQVGQSISLGASVLDLDIERGFEDYQFEWSFLEKPAGSILIISQGLKDTLNVSNSFIPDRKGNFKVQLRVTDQAGGVGVQTFNVSIANSAPVVSISGQEITKRGSSVALSAQVTDDNVEDQFTYEWSLVSKPVLSQVALTQSSGKSTSFTPDRRGDYIFRLVASDGTDASSPVLHTVQATVDKPTAEIKYLEGAPYILKDKEFQAINPSVPEMYLTYRWKLTQVPSSSKFDLSNVLSENSGFTFSPDKVGWYEVGLTILDEGVASDPITRRLYVDSKPPVVQLSQTSESPLYTNTPIQFKVDVIENIENETLKYEIKHFRGTAASRTYTDLGSTIVQESPLIFSVTPLDKKDQGIEVRVNDGYNTAIVSQPFTVDNQSPIIRSVSLSQGPYFLGRMVLINVVAEDPDREDQNLVYQLQYVDPADQASSAILKYDITSKSSLTLHLDFSKEYRIQALVKDPEGFTAQMVVPLISVQELPGKDIFSDVNSSLTNPEDQITQPTNVEQTSDGQLVTIDQSDHSVLIVGPLGNVNRVYLPDDMIEPVSITVGGLDNQIYIGDPQANLIHVVDHDGHLVQSINLDVRENDLIGRIGQKVVVRPDGMVVTLTTTGVIMVFDRSGREVYRSNNEFGFKYYEIILGKGNDVLAFGKSTWRSSGDIYRFSPDFSSKIVIYNINGPTVFAYDPHFCDQLYIHDGLNNRIAVYEYEGALITYIPKLLLFESPNVNVMSMRATDSKMILGVKTSYDRIQVMTFDRFVFESARLDMSTPFTLEDYNVHIEDMPQTMAMGEALLVHPKMSDTSLEQKVYSFKYSWNHCGSFSGVGVYGPGAYPVSELVQTDQNKYLEPGIKYFGLQLLSRDGAVVAQTRKRIRVTAEMPRKDLIDLVAMNNSGVVTDQYLTGDTIFLKAVPDLAHLKYSWDFNANDGIDWSNPDAVTSSAQVIYDSLGQYRITAKIENGLGEVELREIIVWVQFDLTIPKITAQSSFDISVIGNSEVIGVPSPEAMKEGPDGRIYLAERGMVTVFNADQSYHTTIPIVSARILDLDFMPTGEMCVLARPYFDDPDNNRNRISEIYCYDISDPHTPRVVRSLTSIDDVAQSYHPQFMTISQNYIYLMDLYGKVFDMDGNFIRSMATFGDRLVSVVALENVDLGLYKDISTGKLKTIEVLDKSTGLSMGQKFSEPVLQGLRVFTSTYQKCYLVDPTKGELFKVSYESNRIQLNSLGIFSRLGAGYWLNENSVILPDLSMWDTMGIFQLSDLSFYKMYTDIIKLQLPPSVVEYSKVKRVDMSTPGTVDYVLEDDDGRNSRYVQWDIQGNKIEKEIPYAGGILKRLGNTFYEHESSGVIHSGIIAKTGQRKTVIFARTASYRVKSVEPVPDLSGIYVLEVNEQSKKYRVTYVNNRTLERRTLIEEDNLFPSYVNISTNQNGILYLIKSVNTDASRHIVELYNGVLGRLISFELPQTESYSTFQIHAWPTMGQVLIFKLGRFRYSERYQGYIYSSYGEFIRSIGEKGVAKGYIGSAHLRMPSVSFGPKNEIIIADPANYRIQIWKPQNP